MSTPDVTKNISPAPCENSLLFRLNLVLSEISQIYGLPSSKAHQTALFDTSLYTIKGGTADIPHKKYRSSK